MDDIPLMAAMELIRPALFSRPYHQPMKLLRSSLVVLTTFMIGASPAQWEPFASGYTSIRSITTSPGAIYMVSFPFGVLKSINAGASWNPSNNGLPLSGSNIFAQSIGYDGTWLYCGTESGIYRSSDGGTNWTIANTGAPAATSSNYPNKIYHVPGSNTVLALYSAVISSGGGVYRTTDGGANWFSGNGGLSTNMIVYQVAMINGVLYAATSTGIMVSTNLAVSWSPLHPNSNFQTFGIQGNGNRLVVVSTFGFRYSDNGGSSWTNAPGVTAPTKGELIRYDGKFWSIAGSTTTSVYRSSDNGATWAAYTTGLGVVDAIAQEEFHASGTTLYLGCLQDIYGHPGTTVDVEEETATGDLPEPYPTLFTDGFTIDLSSQPSGSTVVLFDAMGREVQRRTDLPAAPVRIAREGMLTGTYRVMLLDPAKRMMTPLGAVVAE